MTDIQSLRSGMEVENGENDEDEDKDEGEYGEQAKEDTREGFEIGHHTADKRNREARKREVDQAGVFKRFLRDRSSGKRKFIR